MVLIEPGDLFKLDLLGAWLDKIGVRSDDDTSNDPAEDVDRGLIRALE